MSSNNHQIELISLLSKNRNAYQHEVLNISVEETHISWVILTGHFAYKIKKELKFGQILDFSTLSLRKKFCQNEVDINRVLCGEEMYIGVVKVVKQKREQGQVCNKISQLEEQGKSLRVCSKDA